MSIEIFNKSGVEFNVSLCKTNEDPYLTFLLLPDANETIISNEEDQYFLNIFLQGESIPYCYKLKAYENYSICSGSEVYNISNEKLVQEDFRNFFDYQLKDCIEEDYIYLANGSMFSIKARRIDQLLVEQDKPVILKSYTKTLFKVYSLENIQLELSTENDEIIGIWEIYPKENYFIDKLCRILDPYGNILFSENSTFLHNLKGDNEKRNSQVELKNSNTNWIFVRLERNDKNFEDTVDLPVRENISWVRDNKKYLLHIFDTENRFYPYYVRYNNSYIFNNKNELINEETGRSILRSDYKTFVKPDSFKDNNDEYDKNPYNEFDSPNEKNEYEDEDYENYDIYKDQGKIDEADSKVNIVHIDSNNNKEMKLESHSENDNFSILTETQEFKYFNDIMPNYIENLLFNDENFPSNDSSVFSYDDITKIKRKPHYDHNSQDNFLKNVVYFFKRPKEFWQNGFRLFKDKIESNDVNQGIMGDCYLMCVLSSLCRRPQLIEKIFKTKEVNNEGFYEIFYFEKNGEKRIIFVDDNFLVSTDNKPIFARPNGEELWVLILEKAFAKYEGGYTNIYSGNPRDAFYFFTGRESFSISYSHFYAVDGWSKLVNSINKGYLCSAYTSKKIKGYEDSKEIQGVHLNHAYSLEDAKEYNNDGNNYRLIRLRNPWGHNEWTGMFSDNYTGWTEDLKKHFNFDEVAGDHGSFWIPLDDFLHIFEEIIICCC